MKAHIPTLSRNGIIKDPDRAMLYLFKSFLTIDKSVSNHWKGEVISLVYLIKKYPKDPEGLKEAVEEALSRVYNRVFDNARIQVSLDSATALSLDDTPAVNISMAILVEDGSKSYQLAATLEDAFKEADDMFGRVVFKGT